MNMKWLMILACGSILALGAGGEEEKAPAKADEKTAFKTYPLRTSADDAAVVIAAVKELLGPNRQVFHIKAENQLLVSATGEEHKQIEALLKEVNVPAPNVRLDVTFREIGAQTDTAASANVSGNVVVTKHGSSSTVKIRPELRNQTTGMDSLNQQTLVVMSGREASIQVSQDVPFYEWFMAFGQQWGIIEQKLIMEKVGSFLTAVPQVVGRGPMISVTLTPELRELAGTSRQRIKFKRVSTTITVEDGATITIGGNTDHKEFYEKFLIGGSASGTRRTLNITLTARILKPDGTPTNP